MGLHEFGVETLQERYLLLSELFIKGQVKLNALSFKYYLCSAIYFNSQPKLHIVQLSLISI